MQIASFPKSDSGILTKCGSVTTCGYFITGKPYTVRCMTLMDVLPMADDRRGLLTPREREIMTREVDVTDEYYYSVVSRVRRKIQRLEDDAKVLREHHEDLYDELRGAVLVKDESSDE